MGKTIERQTSRGEPFAGNAGFRLLAMFRIILTVRGHGQIQAGAFATACCRG